jgi:Ca-activated chloride channel homolog
MIFAQPAWLWTLLTLPIVALAAWWAARRDRERTTRLVSRALWTRVLHRPHERWRPVRLGLVLAGVAGLILALARPQWGIVREKIEREGVDVVFVLDTSGSMATEDVPPNRFFLARAALSTLIARLEGDRLGLVAFEGEAYPLVPLTLDADVLGLFLETLEPGAVPASGTAVGVGLAKGLGLFVDKDRRNKVMVLVSDGEDLEGEVESAVKQAKEAGVIVHTVGVGTERGEPVPDFNREGVRVGFKKLPDGSPVISHFTPATLDAIARGTGGRSFRVTAADTSLQGLAAAIEGLEQKTLSREYAYRKKERFQLPLGASLLAFTLALILPFPLRRFAGSGLRAAAALFLGLSAVGAQAEEAAHGHLADELLLRPKRLTARGREDYARGNHPAALEAFEQAQKARPDDPAARFNVAEGLYRNGKFEEAATLFKALGDDPRSPLASSARYNLGNARYEKQDFKGAIEAYRDALQVAPNDGDTRRNLELALRALQQQEEQQKREQQKQNPDQKQKQDQQQQQQQQQKDDQKKGQPGQERQKSEQEKERERFQNETGMPKERAMQLLDALQQNEKEQQKKLLAMKARKKEGKDW